MRWPRRQCGPVNTTQVLIPAGFFVTFLGYAIADVTALVFRPAPELRPALRVAIAHPNAFAMPLLLLTSFRRVDSPPTGRGDAVAATVDIPWRRVAATPRLAT